MRQIANVETARLTALADYLEYEVPAVDFNLRGWVERIPRERETTLFGLIETYPGCGFAGCAMGWAGYSGLFPGLSVRTDGALIYTVDRGYYQNWSAVMVAMGLNSHMSYFLFSPGRYKVTATPEMVTNRIRRFVAKIEAIRARDRRRVTPEQLGLHLVA